MKYTFRFLALFLPIFLNNSCKEDKPVPPIITTTTVTEISYTTAASGGDVTNDGNAPVTARGVCWNTLADPTILNNITNEGVGAGPFTSIITSLAQNTTYYVRAYATNSAGTGYGNQLSFTTSQIAVAALTTSTITSITQTTAVAGGDITADNGGSVTARGICWSKNHNPTIINNKTIDGTGTGTFTSSIIGLAGGTTYFIRAYATNSAGTSYGNEIDFTTNPATLPVISSTAISNITINSAIGGGTVASDGAAAVTDRGVCWKTSGNPTITNSKTTNGTDTGAFSSSIVGLTANTVYYIKAYATNSAGTAYGNEFIFKTYTGTVTDIVGNIYYTVTIGTQLWMAENLKTFKYNNNDLIGTTTPATLDITSEPNPKYQWAYKGNEANVATYGRLYSWYAATDSRNVCPSSWHVASNTDWTTLTDYLTNNGYGYGGSGTYIGKSIAASSGWTSYTIEGTIGNDQARNNSSGFNALPGGLRSQSGIFNGSLFDGLWWSSTESAFAAFAARMVLNYTHYGTYRVGQDGVNKSIGLSIRCLRDY